MQKHTITVEHPGEGKVTFVMCNVHLTEMLRETLPLDPTIRFTIAPNDAGDAKCGDRTCLNSSPATASAMSLLVPEEGRP